MRKLYYILLALLALLLVSSIASAQVVGSPAPANAVVSGARSSSGNLEQVKTCDRIMAVNFTASTGNKTVIAGEASKKVYVCGFYVSVSSQVGIKFSNGSAGTNCASLGGDITGLVSPAPNSGVSMALSPYAVPFTGTTGADLCVVTDGATNIGGWIAYTIQ